ncbi:hypothetical protein TNCV_1160331 [Trichonephila clavipes]|nr:hypothetical protein TNCV_1160331 [Trichonephila clavipes]
MDKSSKYTREGSYDNRRVANESNTTNRKRERKMLHDHRAQMSQLKPWRNSSSSDDDDPDEASHDDDQESEDNDDLTKERLRRNPWRAVRRN